MKITTFMLCDSINNVNLPQGTVVPQLIMPTTVLRPQFIPSAFSFGIVVGVEGMDLQKDHKMRFRITDPDGNIIQESCENVLPAIPEDSSLPKEYQGYTLSIDIRNLIISKSGLYNFSLFINDEEVCIKSIPVFEAKK
ncbi:MAG: hypothetical protein IKM44_00360 [Clostridia bacterium]|nr:hypothetical protein [Clostridia bacterium]